MSSNQNKTVPTSADVKAFIEAVPSVRKRDDAFKLLSMMQEITGEKPVMWGPSIIGFGSYHYKYDSGREGDSLITGFSPRKQALTIYAMPGFSEHQDLLGKLGKFKTGKSCLYINKLDDVNLDILKEIIESSVAYMRQHYPPGD